MNLTNKNDFPNVKSKYRKLALIYHPDKCPNSKTPPEIKTTDDCEKEMKILNDEYEAIEKHFGFSGGKNKTKRNNKTKKNKKTK